MRKKGDLYQCAICQHWYEEGWEEEAAQAEAKRLWKPEDLTDTVVVCDDCFQKVLFKMAEK